MEDNRCFEPGCMLNVEYECPCSSPPVNACKLHALNHMETPNNDHTLKSILVEPCEKAREAILLPNCNSSIIEDFNEQIQRNFGTISFKEDLEAKKSEILESSKSSELERELKSTCLACTSDSNAFDLSATQAYPGTISNYQLKPYLFNIVYEDYRTNLLIYNTEIESQASITLDTPQPVGLSTCIAQLSHNKLFCFGYYPYSGTTLLIDENYRVQELPSGIDCGYSSAIYFNNNVYCFGGNNYGDCLTLSSRFDLDKNQWNALTPLPNADYQCNSILFNGSILISGRINKNLLRYSIDSNSFSIIPYDFAEKKRKILINAERLYLIECYYGLIYESEIGSDTTWKKIKNNSTINFHAYQTYCQCNKKEIYIGCIDGDKFCCFKFKLNEKKLIKFV